MRERRRASEAHRCHDVLAQGRGRDSRARVAKELENSPRILVQKSVYADTWIADALAESGSPMWLPDERAERARAALSHLAELRVLTLHAFAMTIVRTYALEAGMLPGVDVMTESEDRRVAGDRYPSRDRFWFSRSSVRTRARCSMQWGVMGFSSKRCARCSTA